ncbi:Holliday junction resolvase-like protein [Streptomyces sp. NPDC052396]|uniref:Holliday junction resolvase-like protein n=1 Tax=Streptomyces sp. NPDC052396 TaxID=3365689 RepID=UPI0037D70816
MNRQLASLVSHRCQTGRLEDLGEQVAAVFIIMMVVMLAVAVGQVRSARADAQAQQMRADEAHRKLLIATQNHEKALAERGRTAARSSRSTFEGHIAENAFPYAADHGYHPKDIVHVGGTIDFLVLDGLFEIRQGVRSPDELTVVLADVKYGASALSREQRAVIAAMNEGRTRGEYWKTGREEDGKLEYRPGGEVKLWRSKELLEVRRISAGSGEGLRDSAGAVPDVEV